MKMICKDCGSDCEYLGDTTIGNKKVGLQRKHNLFGCKICGRVYYKKIVSIKGKIKIG